MPRPEYASALLGVASQFLRVKIDGLVKEDDFARLNPAADVVGNEPGLVTIEFFNDVNARRARTASAT